MTAPAEEDTRPRWFAVAPGLTGPAGMIWHGTPVPRPKESAPYLFGPIELSPKGRLLSLDQLMERWRQHGRRPALAARRPPPAAAARHRQHRDDDAPAAAPGAAGQADARRGAIMSAGRSDLVEIAGELRRETDAAFLVFDGTQEVWLPRSKAEHDPDAGTFTLPEWLAQTKGLI